MVRKYWTFSTLAIHHSFSCCRTSVIIPESDHHLVHFEIVTNAQPSIRDNQYKHVEKIPEVATYDFHSADEDKLKQALEDINWRRLLGPESNIKNFKKKLVEGIIAAAKEAKVPKYKDRNNKKKREEDQVITTLQTKHTQLNEALENKSLLQTDRDIKTEELYKVNKDIRERLDQIQEEEETKVASSLKNNSKAFYAYANRSIKLKSTVGPLKEGKHYYSGPKKMAEMLSAQYEGAFSKPLEDYSHIKFQQAACEHLDDLHFTLTEIMEAAQDMCSSSAPGPDGITAFFLKKYIDVLKRPLHYMWRTSLDTGKMPDGINQSVITPIFKGGTRSAPKNYRPVALTNHTTKLFERVLRKAMIDHLESNNLLNEAQHGFRNLRSTITQVMKFYDSILTLLEEGHAVDAIYLDFAKAFDKVDHRILMLKLKSVNISGKIWNWIGEFLQNREQRVRVGSTLSNTKKVRSGVPQGSVLGPLLFLVMICDIDKDTLEAMVGIFADDTRLWKLYEGEAQTQALQEELEKIYAWADFNNATFNADKFEAMRFKKGRTPEQPDPVYLANNNNYIDFKTHIKDLGIWMSANLTFDEHIRVITAKARQYMGIILRTFKSRKTEVMLPLLKSLVRSQVEYACPIWSPTDSANIKKIEEIQRKFTSKFQRFRTYDEELGMTICNVTYEERLKALKLHSLQRRRERYLIMYMYKIKIGLVPNPGFEPDYRRCHKFTYKPRNDRKNGRFSFFCVGPRLYNSLPPELRELDDIPDENKTLVDTFKDKLDQYLQTIPDNPGTQSNSLLNLETRPW